MTTQATGRAGAGATTGGREASALTCAILRTHELAFKQLGRGHIGLRGALFADFLNDLGLAFTSSGSMMTSCTRSYAKGFGQIPPRLGWLARS